MGATDAMYLLEELARMGRYPALQYDGGDGDDQWRVVLYPKQSFRAVGATPAEAVRTAWEAVTREKTLRASAGTGR